MGNGNILSHNKKTLILVTTHRCNQGCWYCPTIKNSDDLDIAIAKRAIELFLKSKSKNYLIRFFGGEPLLRYDMIIQIHGFVKTKYPKKNIKFDVTTNGQLLDRRKINFFKQNQNIELIVNSDTINFRRINDLNIVSMSNSLLNFLILPDNVYNLVDNYIKFTKIGFKRFNFLPAYYVRWTKIQLIELRKQLDNLINIVSIQLMNNNFFIKNLSIRAQTPLFNSAYIVDSNGDIFLNNLFLAKFFNKARNKLRVDNVSNIKSFAKIKNYVQNQDFNSIFKKYVPSKILNSTFTADQILSDFVYAVKHNKPK